MSVAPDLIRNYMLATGLEAGQSWSELPTVLQHEVDNAADIYEHPGNFFVAFAGNSPVGCVGIHSMSAAVADLRRLWVLPEYRGNAVGKRLLQHCVAHCQGAVIETLVLDVLPSRTAVIDWYKRLGFEEIEPFEDLPIEMVYLGASTRDLITRF